MKNRVTLLSVIAGAALMLNACVYHDFTEITTVSNTDQSLFDEVNELGYTYYQGGALLSPVDPSPHGLFKLRFNTIALTSLDGTGELPENAAFKPGAVIVKEIYDANEDLLLYAVIKKAPGDASAQNGHLWAEYALDGTPVVSIEGKGSLCIDCHGATPNRDLLKSFDLH
jgi:hypothetical protein